MAYQPPMNFDEMMKLFDPEQVQRMFDPEQMRAMFTPPPAASVDFATLMQTNQKSYEAMLTANRAAASAYNDFYRKQMEIFHEMMDGARKAIEKDGTGADAAARQTEIYQRATEQALANMTALAEESKKATEQAFKEIEQQVREAVAELQASQPASTGSSKSKSKAKAKSKSKAKAKSG